VSCRLLLRSKLGTTSRGGIRTSRYARPVRLLSSVHSECSRNPAEIGPVLVALIEGA
jgi:hypothetical protein